jgi:hypothetical protein
MSLISNLHIWDADLRFSHDPNGLGWPGSMLSCKQLSVGLNAFASQEKGSGGKHTKKEKKLTSIGIKSSTSQNFKIQ